MKSAFRRSPGDVLFDSTITAVLFVTAIFAIYPVIYVLSLSISSALFVERREVWLWPKGFSLHGYKLILQHEYILKSYANSIFYTSFGTAYSLVFTICGAFALSRRRFPGRDGIMFFVAFTMLFNGGIVPTYLVVRWLGLVNTRAAMIMPTAVAVWNLVIMRTTMQQIPDSIEDSARIDGANDVQIMVRIVVPMSVPVIATVALFYAVAKWNNFFQALIYLNDKNLYPLQLIVRELIIAMSDNLLNRDMMQDPTASITPASFRAAVIVITILPLLIVYPFVQKYFVKGIMIGAIKG